jgi:SAM-dependent methyltransferase
VSLDLARLPTEERPLCPLHPAAGAAADPRAAALLGLVPPYGVLACRRCGLRWLSPRPDETGYAALYAYDVYFEGASVESYARLAELRRPYFRRRLERIEAAAGAAPLRLLDVGAATGELVAEAAARGHDAVGYEPSEGARSEAARRHGLELAGGRLADLAGRGPFDVAHLNHVVEHLPEPLEVLSMVADLLRPGGLLVVEVPQQLRNALDPIRRAIGRGRRGRFDAYSLHHTYFFAPGNLRELLAAAGFAVDEIATWRPAQTPIAPLSPATAKNLLLSPYLFLADRLASAGTIIEAWARRAGGA